MSAHDRDDGFADFVAPKPAGRPANPPIRSIVARAHVTDARKMIAIGMGYAVDPHSVADLESAAAHLEAAVRKLREAAEQEAVIRRLDKW
jgi:hypothetical protein